MPAMRLSKQEVQHKLHAEDRGVRADSQARARTATKVKPGFSREAATRIGGRAIDFSWCSPRNADFLTKKASVAVP